MQYEQEKSETIMLEHTQPSQSPSEERNRGSGSKNRVPNAFFMLIAGRRFRAYSLLTHIGRRSGREYRTPITAFPLGDGFVFALLYGKATEVDWCLNVMAAGRCILKTRGREYVLEKPEIIPALQALPAYPPLFRRYYQFAGTQEFLWAHVASAQ